MADDLIEAGETEGAEAFSPLHPVFAAAPQGVTFRKLRKRLVGMHARAPEGLGPIPFEMEQNPEFHMGGGGLYGTAADYIKFTQMILNKGRGNGNQLLKPETVTLKRELPGRVSPFLVAEVRPQVNGIIARRLYTEGGLVQAGQPLYKIASLDSLTLRAYVTETQLTSLKLGQQVQIAQHPCALGCYRDRVTRFEADF